MKAEFFKATIQSQTKHRENGSNMISRQTKNIHDKYSTYIIAFSTKQNTLSPSPTIVSIKKHLNHHIFTHTHTHMYRLIYAAYKKISNTKMSVKP